MFIYAGFTWEFIIKQCERLKRDFARRQEDVIRIQAIIDLVPKLRAYPDLEKLVPMLSMGMLLRWFPSDELAVGVEFMPHISKYSVSVMGRMSGRSSERKLVAMDEVADQVYAYIKQHDDGTITYG